MLSIELVNAEAEIVRTTLKEPGREEPGAKTVCRFWADLRIDGVDTRIEREAGTQACFYEPWTVGDVRIWLDSVDAVFAFLRETHGPCRRQENCSHDGPPPPNTRYSTSPALVTVKRFVPTLVKICATQLTPSASMWFVTVPPDAFTCACATAVVPNASNPAASAVPLTSSLPSR
jgi:hypothetical protein